MGMKELEDLLEGGLDTIRDLRALNACQLLLRWVKARGHVCYGDTPAWYVRGMPERQWALKMNAHGELGWSVDCSDGGS